MMSRVEFRGKRLSDGIWTYGCGVYYEHLIQKKIDGEKHIFIEVPCIKNTIGQFIGFRDKTDRKIFSGDILQTKYGIIFIMWSEVGFTPYKYSTTIRGHYGTFTKFANWEKILSGHIIGNVHDNPTLLKEVL